MILGLAGVTSIDCRASAVMLVCSVGEPATFVQVRVYVMLAAKLTVELHVTVG